MKISNLIFFGFLLILLLFTATTYMNFRQAEQVNENSEFFARSTTIVRQLNRFQRNMVNMVSGLRGYLFTGENFFVQAYDSAAAENVSILKELTDLIPDTSVQHTALNEIKAMNDGWLANFGEPLIAAKKSEGLSDSSRAEFRKLYYDKLSTGKEAAFNRRLQEKVRDFSNYEYQMRDIRKDELTATLENTRRISFALTTVSVVVGLAIAFFLAFRISSKIMKMVQLADTIAAGNYDVQNIDEGKDELSRLSKSLNHMAKVLSENIALLQRKNEELGQFAHIVSHDLKAPLRGIDNVVTWIEEDHHNELSPKVKEYVALIKGRLIRAENLIQGILQYSRIGRDLPEKEQVDLNALIGETLETIPRDTSIKVHIQKDLPTIMTERIPLQQVLTNLIANSIKYHDKKQGGEVSVSFKTNTTHHIFTVADNGPGIDKVYHDKIFMIFQTLQERDSFESTGVGLAIVKKILDDRKQTINVESTPGKGASFTFTWPK